MTRPNIKPEPPFASNIRITSLSEGAGVGVGVGVGVAVGVAVGLDPGAKKFTSYSKSVIAAPLLVFKPFTLTVKLSPS